MILIRGTEKLLKRLGGTPGELGASTNILGDWYANLVHIGSSQFVLYTNAASLLCVVSPALLLKHRILQNLRDGLGTLLLDIGIPESQILTELEAMNDYQIGPTASRSVLGSMNDFAVALSYMINDSPLMDLRDVNVHLCKTPCSPIGYDSPAERAVKIFKAMETEHEKRWLM
jgi:hypothetical protein